MKTLGLIPARGGSKGVARKNLTLLAGRSLVQRAFECARGAQVLDRIILSTDDSEVAHAARGYDLEVPFLRPLELARDDSPMIDVAIHALISLKEIGYVPDAILLLQPTSPLRQPEHILRALDLLQDYDSVCSVVPLPQDQCPHYVMKITSGGFLDYFMPDGERYTRRQDVPLAYKRDGTIFLTRTEVVLEQGSLYGKRCVPLVIGSDESLNIDDAAEWAEAERRLKVDVHEPSFG